MASADGWEVCGGVAKCGSSGGHADGAGEGGMRKEVLAASDWPGKPEPPNLTRWWASSKERAGSSLGVSPRCWKKAEVVASVLAAKGDW
jgi:hypothetical protein